MHQVQSACGVDGQLMMRTAVVLVSVVVHGLEMREVGVYPIAESSPVLQSTWTWKAAALHPTTPSIVSINLNMVVVKQWWSLISACRASVGMTQQLDRFLHFPWSSKLPANQWSKRSFTNQTQRLRYG
jgi:hypothetical protein